MTGFELLCTLLRPFDYPQNQFFHAALKEAIEPGHVLLDVGGRRSNYTIGLPAMVWISDIPQELEIQKALDLGATDVMRDKVLSRRSNVHKYVYDDMAQTKLPAERFDVVSAVEVLEHVDDDSSFVRNVASVLKPGGRFLMTTPNGDFRPVPYPDHKRHYKAKDLEALLRGHFSEVKVTYWMNSGRLIDFAYRQGKAGRAWLGMPAYALSALLERGAGPMNKLHLFAACRK